jgi:cysteine desulfurase/selenocysteine lyase
MDYNEKRLRYRKEFPILNREIYLNHAGHGPWSASSLKAMDIFMRSFCFGPMLPYAVWNEEQDRTRSLMAQLLNAAPDEIAFNYNTSLSLIMFTNAVNWEKGDNIIVPDKCFPSVVHPARLLRQDGVEARIVDVTDDGLISEDSLISAIDSRTRMMIVPLVSFVYGQMLDIPKLNDACRDAGVYLVVDAIQAVGPMKVDVKELGCHALCFGSPKWMFGPMGIGTVYVNHDDMEAMRIPQMGMWSVDDPWNFFDYDQPLVSECRRFECGCSNNLAHFGINPNLEMFLDLGPEHTEKYLLELTAYLHDELTGRGIKVVTPREDERRAAIVTFDAVSAGWDNPDLLLETLNAANIRVSVRMGLVRVSPHFYNNREEIDKLLEVVTEPRA